MARTRLPAASDEVAKADFGDARLTRRLMRIADAAATAPSAGLPRIAGSDAELEGVYRFLRNERVTPQRIFAPHVAATRERAGSMPVVIAHDTTEFAFYGSAHREGLGRIGTSKLVQGFHAHFALALSADELHSPLGVVGLKSFARPWRPRNRIPKKERDANPDQSEAIKWTEVAFQAATAIPGAVHVMDREADSFTTIARLMRGGLRFVVRLCRDKKLQGSSEKLFQAAARAPSLAERTVPLSSRPKQRSGGYDRSCPPREARTAKLELRAGAFTLPRPNRSRYRTGEFPESVSVNVVTVQEVEAPPGEVPVSWILLTAEPVDTPAQVEAVVDAYRARWRIEEFFKALKTGCAFEKRQLESLRTLVNALAVFSTIAWRLLLLRSLSRASPETPATAALTSQQLQVLKAVSGQHAPGLPLINMPARPTVADALHAVAALGGHIKNNGPPGWLVLGRGYDSLLLLQLGWQARERCDR